MHLLYGPVNVPSTSQPENCFPHNISFIQGNYVLEFDVLISMEQPQFDTILCLGVTKWLHLNWGDEGLKQAFKHMYAQLRPGGVLILEPQPWHSYKKKRNLTPQIWRNYQSIRLFPHKFSQFLLSEVGFTKFEVIGAPLHQSRGFQRSIKLFTKGYSDFQLILPISSSTVVTENASDKNTVTADDKNSVSSTKLEVIISDKTRDNSIVTSNNENTSDVVLDKINKSHDEMISCDNKIIINDSDGDKQLIGIVKNTADLSDTACDITVCHWSESMVIDGDDKSAINPSETIEMSNEGDAIVDSSDGNSVRSNVDRDAVGNSEQ